MDLVHFRQLRLVGGALGGRARLGAPGQRLPSRRLPIGMGGEETVEFGYDESACVGVGGGGVTGGSMGYGPMTYGHDLRWCVGVWP